MKQSLMTSSLTSAALAVALCAASGVATQAATAIGGGETKVTVTADLGGLGLAGAPFGVATADLIDGAPVFTFPITGGALTPMLSIEHEGSGVTLTAIGDASLSATIGNFLIADGKISGDVIGGPSNLDFFLLSDAGADGLSLAISDALAGALTGIFGAPDLTGAEFGLATSAPQPVPLPAAALLLLGALGTLGTLGTLGAVARRRVA